MFFYTFCIYFGILIDTWINDMISIWLLETEREINNGNFYLKDMLLQGYGLVYFHSL